MKYAIVFLLIVCNLMIRFVPDEKACFSEINKNKTIEKIRINNSVNNDMKDKNGSNIHGYKINNMFENGNTTFSNQTLSSKILLETDVKIFIVNETSTISSVKTHAEVSLNFSLKNNINATIVSQTYFSTSIKGTTSECPIDKTNKEQQSVSLEESNQNLDKSETITIESPMPIQHKSVQLAETEYKFSSPYNVDYTNIIMLLLIGTVGIIISITITYINNDFSVESRRVPARRIRDDLNRIEEIDVTTDEFNDEYENELIDGYPVDILELGSDPRNNTYVREIMYKPYRIIE